MKKKLFLLITCFFLFSSLTIFLTHRNIQLSETIKNREEEAERLLKELKEQKEKNNANQEKEKNENKVNQEDNQKNNQEDNQEETDNLPWLFTWTGAVINLMISIVIYYILFNYNQNFKKKIEAFNNNMPGTLFFLALIIILFYIGVLIVVPPIFAIKKYKNKSYWERLKLIEKNFLIFIICATIFTMMMISLVAYEAMKDPTFEGNNNNIFENNI